MSSVERARDQRRLRALLAAVEGDRSLPVHAPPPEDTADGDGDGEAGGEADLLALARHHRLTPLLGARLASAPAGGSRWPASITAACRTDRLATLGRTTLLRHALAEVLRALGGRGVEAAVLKGIAYEERVYADTPGARPATDVDLLVRPDARRPAFATLLALGYHPAAGAPGYDEPDYHEVTFRRGDVYLDLHFALAPLPRCRIDYRALWAEMQPLDVDGAATRTLGDVHAAINQALHMAIHHFDVPALYLVDLARLLRRAGGHDAVLPLADAWRCRRPLETAAALAAAFLPAGGGQAAGAAEAEDLVDGGARRGPLAARVYRVIDGYGGRAAVPRAEQLRRKVEHFDAPADAARYLLVQGRRVVRERLLALGAAPRTAAQRLGIGTAPAPPAADSRRDGSSH